MLNKYKQSILKKFPKIVNTLSKGNIVHFPNWIGRIYRCYTTNLSLWLVSNHQN